MPPTRRALLLGARAPDLRGVDHDLELMHEALLHHGFADEHIETVVPATRNLMATAIQGLIARTQPRDAVVVYYSGHGSKLDDISVSNQVANPRAPVLGESAYYRFLVPTDIEQSTDEDFRGYTNVELSLDLEALTRKTRNVVVIMDCCHAGRIFRADRGDKDEHIAWQDPNSRHPPARNVDLTGRWARAAANHFERLQATRSHEMADRHAEANPWAVRLLASASEGCAFETRCPSREGCEHEYCGATTLALHAALMKVDPRRTTWQDLGRLLRVPPQRGYEQHVCVEGPHQRFLFELEERESLGEIDLDFVSDRIQLAGGRLVGLAEGDRFELQALRRGIFEGVGDAEVTRVGSSYAEIAVNIDPGQGDGLSHACPVSHGAPRATVELVGIERDSKAHELLAARLGASGYIRVLDDGPSVDREHPPSVGQIRLERGNLQLSSGGIAFDIPRSFDPGRAPTRAEQLADHMADGVRRLARAFCLRTLPLPRDNERLEPCWDLSWASHEAGQIARTLAPNGEQLRVGDGFTVRLTCTRPLYFSALLVRADARIELLTQAQGGGVEVIPGQGYLLGQRSGSTSAKLLANRPPNTIVSGNAPIWSALVLVLSDLPVDLRSWVQPGLSRFVIRDNLEPKSHGRNISPRNRGFQSARYHVETWTFDVI